MCISYVEVGYLKRGIEAYDRDALDSPIEAALLRNNGSEKNEWLEAKILEIGSGMKCVCPEREVIMREHFYCNGADEYDEIVYIECDGKTSPVYPQAEPLSRKPSGAEVI